MISAMRSQEVLGLKTNSLVRAAHERTLEGPDPIVVLYSMSEKLTPLFCVGFVLRWPVSHYVENSLNRSRNMTWCQGFRCVSVALRKVLGLQ